MIPRHRLRSIAADLPLAAVLVIFGHYLFDRFDATGFGVVIPEVQRAFGLSLTGISALGAGAAAVAILLAVPVSFSAEHTRHRLAYLAAATALAGALDLVAGVATGVVLFGLARSGTGLGLRVSDPVQQGLLADYAPVERRPAVYSGRAIAYSLGGIVGPVVFGIVAALAGWRWALLLEGVPMLALAAITLRLPEPSRGCQERMAMGITGEGADVEEEPPSWPEAFEILKSVRSLRRLWYALPFLVGGALGLAYLFPLFEANVFHLGPAQRGTLASVSEVFSIAGLLVGIPLSTRLLRSDRPDALMRVMAVAAVVVAALLTAVAEAPDVAALAAALFAVSVIVAVLTPAFATLLSLVLPPPVRSFGFALSAVYAIPGLALLPLAGRVGDLVGLRDGILCCVPVFLLGALVVASAGNELGADMRSNVQRAAAALEGTRARAAGRAKMLVCRGVEASYGAVPVLFGIDFDVGEGEMVALLGTNGAGKSTLLRTISGHLKPTGGAIVFDGREITQTPPAQTAAMGIVSVPGGRGVFPGLSVRENLGVAGWLSRRDPGHLEPATAAALELFPVLADRLEQRAGDLSGGEQQMLTLAQAFVAKPRLLLIDELSLGLAPLVVAQLLETLRLVNQLGTTVVLVEQSVTLALEVCERAVFLDEGAVAYDGPASGLLDRPGVVRAAFLGHAATARESREAEPCSRVPEPDFPGAAAAGDAVTVPSSSATPVLEAVGLCRRFGGINAVTDVSVAIAPGEIVGLIGPNGAGKTTVIDLLSGFLRPDGGIVLLGGDDASTWSPERRARSGLGRSFQSARLFESLSVADTVAVARDQSLAVRDPLSSVLWLPAARDAEAALRLDVDEVLELTGLSAYRDHLVGELSTGTRRIVDMACALASSPSVLLLDEPATGIAQREVEALGPLLRWIQIQTGAALLVVEHDMGLVNAVADRVVAMEAGSVIVEGSPAEVMADPAVVASYLGDGSAALVRSGGSE